MSGEDWSDRDGLASFDEWGTSGQQEGIKTVQVGILEAQAIYERANQRVWFLDNAHFIVLDAPNVIYEAADVPAPSPRL